jgi:tRNA dimethylallyltransferase
MEISLDRVGNARAVLLAGPTASGKSAAALRLAEQAAARDRGAFIVNADSMQVYDALRVLTARPTPKDEASVPHRLYGHVPAAERYSVGAWLSDMKAVLGEAEAVGALPIVVGGTGLYFKALTEGLVAMPAIPREVRAFWSERLAAEGAAALHAELVRRDAAAALAIRPSDAQRIVRALEVLEATGRPLAEWRKAAQPPPLLPVSKAACFVLEPARAALYQRIEERFDRMVAEGALQEVDALLQQDLDTRMPVMKATGVRELSAVLRNEISLSEASARAKMETRRYAKRQLTWLRHQMREWPRVAA